MRLFPGMRIGGVGDANSSALSREPSSLFCWLALPYFFSVVVALEALAFMFWSLERLTRGEYDRSLLMEGLPVDFLVWLPVPEALLPTCKFAP